MNTQQLTIALGLATKRIADLEQQNKQLRASNTRLREFKRSVFGIVEQVRGKRQHEQPKMPEGLTVVDLTDLLIPR